MSNDNIYDLEAFKNRKKEQFSDPLFQKQIDRMDKIKLLEEMVKYHDARSKAENPTNIFWTIRGIILFTALEKTCETPEMVGLAGSYKRHLQHELEIKKGPPKK